MACPHECECTAKREFILQALEIVLRKNPYNETQFNSLLGEFTKVRACQIYNGHPEELRKWNEQQRAKGLEEFVP
jgi:hypothetical protein